MIKELFKKLTTKGSALGSQSTVQHDSICKKIAFTLAEVLITLGIIGVVAAMTIPTIVKTYQQKNLEVKLKNFSATINQVLKIANNDNGDYANYVNNIIGQANYEQNVQILKIYIFPYIKVTKFAHCSSNLNRVCVYLTNGDLFSFEKWNDGTDFTYFPNGYYPKKLNTRNCFLFQFNKAIDPNNLNNKISLNYIEPYIARWDGNVENLKKGPLGCHKNSTYFAYCTKLIEMNNWKIPKDYPW